MRQLRRVLFYLIVQSILAMFGTGRVIAVFNRIMDKHVKWLMSTDS